MFVWTLQYRLWLHLYRRAMSHESDNLTKIIISQYLIVLPKVAVGRNHEEQYDDQLYMIYIIQYINTSYTRVVSRQLTSYVPAFCSLATSGRQLVAITKRYSRAISRGKYFRLADHRCQWMLLNEAIAKWWLLEKVTFGEFYLFYLLKLCVIFNKLHQIFITTV